MIIGQLIGGAMGDLIGRKQGMMLVMFLQVIGSVGSASSYDGFGGWSVFEQLAIWRFLVGIGCGGVYPLAALLSSEAMMIPMTSQSSGQQQQHQQGGEGMEEEAEMQLRKLKMLAATFSTQGIGFVTVPIVALGLLIICGEGRLDIVWRMMLLVGALPGIVLMFFRWKAMSAMHVSATVPRDIDGGGEEHGNGQGHRDEDDGELEGIENQVMEVDMDPISDRDAAVTNTGVLHADERHENASLWTKIKSEDQLFTKLIGTAGENLYRRIDAVSISFLLVFADTGFHHYVAPHILNT
jgi:PHS family inorganic phosphate transporter-like MFS transporter